MPPPRGAAARAATVPWARERSFASPESCEAKQRSEQILAGGELEELHARALQCHADSGGSVRLHREEARAKRRVVGVDLEFLAGLLVAYGDDAEVGQF